MGHRGTLFGLYSLFLTLIILSTACGGRRLLAPGAFSWPEVWPMFRGNPQHSGFAPVDGRHPLRLDWTFEAGRSIHASPVTGPGRICIASLDKKLHVLDMSGKPVGRVDVEGSVSSTPAMADGVLFVGTEHPQSHLCAVDLASGRMLWKRKVLDVVSSPVVVSGMVIFSPGDGSLQAATADSGHAIWSFQTQHPISSSPAVDKDVVVFGSLNHSVYALRLADGELLWTGRTGGPIDASPAIDAGLVFVGSLDSTFYAFDLERGEVRWSFPAGGAIHSSAAVDDSTCYFGSDDGHLYAVGKEDGRHRWTWMADSIIRSSPVVSRQAVFFGSYDGHFYMLDKLTGAVIWKHRTDSSIISSPAISSTGVYVGCADGRLYAFRFEE